MQTLTDLIDFYHKDAPYNIREHVLNEVARSADNNKGFFWEKVLAKAMPHAKLIGGNNKGYDFEPCKSDAKISTFYRKSDGIWEASIGITNKIGTLRVCLVVPGQYRHRLIFMLIPYEAYKNYQRGSSALKVRLNRRGNICDENLKKYVCKWTDVIKPLDLGNLTT
jgi:hypothetical protein